MAGPAGTILPNYCIFCLEIDHFSRFWFQSPLAWLQTQISRQSPRSYHVVFHILPCQVRLTLIHYALEVNPFFLERMAPNFWYAAVQLLG
jgi:hypothetical protein